MTELYKGFIIKYSEDTEAYIAYRSIYYYHRGLSSYEADVGEGVEEKIDRVNDFGSVGPQEFNAEFAEEKGELLLGDTMTEVSIRDGDGWGQTREVLTNALKERLIQALVEEAVSGPDYREMAAVAYKLEEHTVGITLDNIAEDEERHKALISTMLTNL